MWQDAEQVIRAQLAPGETAIWTGRPRTGLVFRPYDLLITIFSAIWLMMAIYITSAARSMGKGMTPSGFRITSNPFTGRPMFMRPLAIFESQWGFTCWQAASSWMRGSGATPTTASPTGVC